VRITELVRTAYAALYQGEESGTYPVRPVVTAMDTISGDLQELARFDPSVTALAEQATDLHYQLEDLATSLRAYRDGLDFDPARLDEIEDRLALIRSLKRKYGVEVRELLERAESAEAEIERLSHSAEHIADLEQREAAMLDEISASVSELSRRRRTTSYALSQTIETAMNDLAMPHVRFAVSMARVDDPAGVVVREDGDAESTAQPAADPPTTYAFDKTGIDRVEFMISPNPGEPLKPLARIASGGESARLLLALKSILSHVDTIPTLVFDEIDVGVGGRAGQVVGQKLWGMTETHQVLCITHLPQVAAFADTHFAINKEVVRSTDGGDIRTRTNVRILSFEDRVNELAAMLDGTPVSEHSRISAQGILERAHSLKQHTPNSQSTPQPSEPLEKRYEEARRSPPLEMVQTPLIRSNE
jgi:DNA repair protein RecN (Recombination protein N)